MRSVEGGELRVESQRTRAATRSGADSPLSTLNPPPSRRRGVTLVELLITILIISILAGLILGVAALAGENAREAQTRHVVARLHTLLMEHYGTYKSRRVRLNPAVEAAIDGIDNKSAAQKGQLRAEARLYALREMMLMEVPDRWSDILLTEVPATNAGAVQTKSPLYLDPKYLGANGRTDLASVYLRRYFQVAQNANTAEQVKALMDNQSAECLYMVITVACGDGEARSLFGENSIGDTDGDGAREFLDGWGHPINFLRWAPGFDSQIQIDANQIGGDPISTNTAWRTAAAGDHDPLDLFRTDLFAFRLVPLIFSAGGDETFGIRPAEAPVTWLPQSSPSAGLMAPGHPRLSPYWKVTDAGGDVYPGTAGEGSADNIHNHLLGQR